MEIDESNVEAARQKMAKLPDIKFGKDGIGKITTKRGNTYSIVEVPDATYMSAMSKAQTDVVTAYANLISASLSDPKMSVAEVKNNLYGGDFMFLGMTLSKYYEAQNDFL